MDNSEKDIEDLFNDRFKEDEAAVSSRVWDNIKKTLPKESADAPTFRNANKKLLSIILAIVVVSGATFFAHDKIKRTENIEQETLNTEHKTENTELETRIGKLRTGNTEQENAEQGTGRKEKNTDYKTKTSDSKNNFPNITLTDKNKIRDSKKNFGREENGNTTLKNKKLNEIKTGVNNNNNSGDKNKKMTSEITSTTNDYAAKDKNSVIKKNSDQTFLTSQKRKDTVIIQSIGSYHKQNKDKPVYDKTKNSTSTKGLAKEHPIFTDEKSGNKINLFSSNDTTKESKTEPLTYSSVKNDLNKVPTNNPDILSNTFSDSANISKNQEMSSPIFSETDSDNKLVALKKDKTNNKAQDSTIVASTSIVPKKDSIQPDSLVKQITAVDTVATANKKEKTNNLFLSKLSFDLLLSPGITGTTVSANFTDSISQQKVAHKKNNSANKITLSGGLRVNYSLSERLTISTGIFYSSYSQTYKLPGRSETSSAYVPDSSVAGSTKDSIGSDTSGTIYGPSHFVYNYFKTLKTTTTEYPDKTVSDRYTFISIPLTASYTIINKRTGIVCLAGVSTNILVKGVSHYVNENFTNLVSNSKFTSVNLGITGGIGLSYKMTEHLSFIVEPRVNYFLSNIETSSSFIKQKPHSINVNAGLRFKF